MLTMIVHDIFCHSYVSTNDLSCLNLFYLPFSVNICPTPNLLKKGRCKLKIKKEISRNKGAELIYTVSTCDFRQHLTIPKKETIFL
jgi:hypothetical protein